MYKYKVKPGLSLETGLDIEEKAAFKDEQRRIKGNKRTFKRKNRHKSRLERV